MPATDASSSNRATHPNLHIRNAHEAHTLFEAVRLGLLPIVRRRLSPTDRELQSGEVFVWEEASYKGGLERWTDGRKWSQSRMREPFLFYEEKAMPSREEKDAKAARRARKSSDPVSPGAARDIVPPSSPSPRRQDRPTKVKGLTKQTYSAYVTAPGSTGPPKKWHLTAYFCSSTYGELPLVTDDPVLRTIEVPKDVYVTGKGLTRKNNTRGVGGSIGSDSHTVTPSPSMKDFHHGRPSSTIPYQPSPTVSARTSFESPSTSYKIHRPSSEATTESGDGSMSPWSSSSDAASAMMPVTPPQHSAGLPPLPSQYHPYTQHHAYPPPPPPPPHQYYAPQPQHHLPYVYETAVPPTTSPVVFDATPRPASTLPPLRSAPYISSSPPSLMIEEKVPLAGAPLLPLAPPSTTIVPASVPSYPPPHPSPEAQYPAYPPPQPQQQQQQQQYSPLGVVPVGYTTSDVRGECYTQPPVQPPSPTPTTGGAGAGAGAGVGPRYSARHSLDKRALGAFRIAL